MSMKSKDSKDQLGKLSQPEPEMDSGGADRSKRRLLRGVITTAPVVMAVSSKPALANFCTVSGFLSGNLSNHATEGYRCGGRSPGYWKNHDHNHKSHSFKEVFGDNWRGDYSVYLSHNDHEDEDEDDYHNRNGGQSCYRLSYDGKWDGEPTLDRVFNMDGNDDIHKFGAHAAAAYMNAVAFPGTYPMTTFQVGEIVVEVLSTGEYYHKTTGKTLDVEEVVEFFKQTFDAG